MTALGAELRQATRILFKHPGFSTSAILILALAIGANAGVFSIVNGLLLRPLAASHPEQLVSLYTRSVEHPDQYNLFTHAAYREVEQSGIFSRVLAHTPVLVGVADGDTTRRAFADLVSDGYFATLGAPLVTGRPFSAAEATPGRDIPVAIISDRLYGRLGRPADILARTVRINQRDFQIVGVTRSDFTGTAAVISPELWLPLGVWDGLANDFMRGEGRQSLAAPDTRALVIVARLRPDRSVAASESALAPVASRLSADAPSPEGRQQLLVRPIARISTSTRPPDETELVIAAALLLSVGAVVLVIACFNIANVQLARGMARRREFGIRRALGAGRWQIVRQLLLEGLVLSALAGVAGLVVAFWVARAVFASFDAIAPLPIVVEAMPDIRVLGVAAFWAVLSTLVFTLGPAWRVTRSDITSDLLLRPSVPRFGSRLRRWLTGPNTLVVAQLALSLVLLTTAGLFVRGATRAADANPGFTLDHQILAMIDPALAGYGEARTRQVQLAAVDRLRRLPGVENASFASTVPYGDVQEGGGTAASAGAPPEARISATFTIVGSRYFATLGMPLVRGRDFSPAEELGGDLAPMVGIVDRPLAKRLWPGGDPLGRTAYAMLPGKKAHVPVTVIGLVEGRNEDVVASKRDAHLYLAIGQVPRSAVTVHVRTSASSDEPSMLSSVREVLREVDPSLPVLKLTTFRSHRDSGPTMWLLGLSGRLFGAIGVLAAVLSAVGLYGVVAFVVSRRVREFGIRMALGATSRDVLLAVLGDGAVLVVAGLALGLALSEGAAVALRSAVGPVAASDAVVFTVGPALLAGAALLACLVPAARAARMTPLGALREE